MKENKKAIFAAGCFWGVEDKFSKIPGVIDVKSGYTGGTTDNPTYESVCSGTTAHAEAVEVTYEIDVVSYEKLVDFFFQIHNPSTKDRQGFDVGSQYRSAIFYIDEEQKNIATNVKNKIEEEKGIEIVTEITKVKEFYDAEEYHQDYIQKRNT